ncbi:AGE family epimerase/isomerase [Flavilitoribacter nigricans]|uniref:N-acyl-D-glucosamine 2-epimerase n=1 Tax=Flavilitoribacter nigricans (strain ATCC 23147 / DSM 23189 / NBRC 102662 / NCIMB 1420 / SS-2) TaxID=1122177 RepID=A0A2D0MY85_FLAN2|nr:AGE family epimerase/isomerase [Flavilitoribacter nigricans]PHN01242.1 N-acyl-D-glucosamine 2-epimerase [Flavilitoribacter nigricans DSM 23189 = NBRC 102662]
MQTTINKALRAQLQQPALRLKNALEQELDHLLHWWAGNLTDEQHGGFYGRIDGHNRIHPTANKGVLLNTGLLWAFSIAGRTCQSPVYRSLADRAWYYIQAHFIDDVEGGVFRELDFRGAPIRTQKQVDSQAFSIYAFSEYYRLSGNRETLRLAQEIFFLLERYSFDKEKSGYLEALSREWMRLDAKENAVKTLHTHLHLLQAYTNLYRVYPDPSVRDALRALIRCFIDQFIDPQSWHLRLHFDADWTNISTTISFGHDLAVSWLLTDTATVLGDASLLNQCREIAVAMTRACRAEGVDNDGGFFYERVPGQYTDHGKYAWVQSEAVVGLLNAFQIRQEAEMFLAAQRSWDFIERAIRDKDGGTWHRKVNREQVPVRSEDKVGSGHSTYHHVRALTEGIERINTFL